MTQYPNCPTFREINPFKHFTVIANVNDTRSRPIFKIATIDLEQSIKAAVEAHNNPSPTHPSERQIRGGYDNVYYHPSLLYQDFHTESLDPTAVNTFFRKKTIEYIITYQGSFTDRHRDSYLEDMVSLVAASVDYFSRVRTH